MKNRVETKAGKIILLTLVMGILSVAAVFSETSGTLTLQGTVPEILEISVNAEAKASDLDLTQDASNVKVATVVERSNQKSGYTVTLESKNATEEGTETGVFTSSDSDNTDSLDYTITYDEEQVTFSGGSATVSTASDKTTASGSSKSVAISYNGSSNFLYEGTYGDTLTFTITAK